MVRGRFAGQVVFVTGGTSGLGADTAELFIEEGARVFVVDLAERDILKRLGSNAHFQKCDVSSPEDCENAIKACIEQYGRIDVLFHNAARLAPVGTVVDHDVKLFQDMINTNLCGFFYLSRVAIPQMKQQGKGSIIATASTAGLSGDFGICAYSASKHGTVGLMKAMALDHAKDNIRVNCVCPGYRDTLWQCPRFNRFTSNTKTVVTPMTTGFREDAALHDALLGGIPMGRGSDPKEIGKAVLFLSSDDASFITGHAMVIDGGSIAHSGFPNFLKFLGPEAKDSNASSAQMNGVPEKKAHKKKISMSQKSPGLWQAVEEDDD